MSSIHPPSESHVREEGSVVPPASAGPSPPQGRSLDTRARIGTTKTRIPRPMSAHVSSGALPFPSRPLSPPHLGLEATGLPSGAETRVGPQSTVQRSGQGEVPTAFPASSPRPDLGENSSSNNTTDKRARRFHQNGPLATPGQRVRANIELWREHDIAFFPPDMLDADVKMKDVENVSPSHDLSSFSGGPLELVSIDEFEKANPYTPPPRRTAPPLKSDSKHGEFTKRLHWACDARGIARDFMFHEVAKGCFDVELRFNGILVDRIGPYASHRDAREEICKKHLATAESMPNQKKRKVDNAAYSSVPAGIDDEPWINLVHEYFQRNQLPPPDFDFPDPPANRPSWSCTLRIESCPTTLFGGSDKLYASKTNAKKAAAMEAVQWLRAQNKMRPTQEKRRKSSGVIAAEPATDSTPDSLPDEQGHAGLSQVLQPFNVNTSHAKPSEQVHQLALQLGLTQPCYRHVAVPMSDAFYDTFAEFIERDVRKEPRVGGKVGLVTRIYGKNAAKQACATQVLEVLAEIRRSRVGC